MIHLIKDRALLLILTISQLITAFTIPSSVSAFSSFFRRFQANVVTRASICFVGDFHFNSTWKGLVHIFPFADERSISPNPGLEGVFHSSDTGDFANIKIKNNKIKKSFSV